MRAGGISLSLNFTVDEECYLVPLILRLGCCRAREYAISDYAVAVTV